MANSRSELRQFVAAVIVISIGCFTTAATATQPKAINVENQVWIKPPPIPGLSYTWVQGNESDTKPYTVRVTLEQGTRVPPHSHPDERITTVLSGTLYVGFGVQFEPSALVPIQAGELYVAPSGVAHFILAKDGAVVYQESGYGPSATVILSSGQ